METHGRTQDINGSGNGNENSSEDGNGGENKDGIGEGGGEVTNRKKTHKSSRRDMRNRQDLNGKREKNVDNKRLFSSCRPR